MLQAIFTPEIAGKVYAYATDREKCLNFQILDKDESGIYCAVAVVEYSPDNIRVNKFYFRETTSPRPCDYFGTGAGFVFAGSSSAPVEKLGG